MLQLSLVAFDDGVPEDRAETEISVTVRRNENPPTLPPNLGPYIISYEVRPGYVIVIVNATDGDGVSYYTVSFRVVPPVKIPKSW